MNKVYRHKPLAMDEYIGRVDENGKVFRHQVGPDVRVGYVKLENGKVYESRRGPNRNIGRVDLGTGEVFLTKMGPDEYIGKVQADGKCYYHKSLAKDEYIGKITEMSSLAHGGAAYLLLIMPKIEYAREEAAKKVEQEQIQDELNENLDGLETA